MPVKGQAKVRTASQNPRKDSAAPRRIRVLLADADAEEVLMLRQWLDACQDIEVVAVASTGQEALDQALEMRSDVVLMDVHLPGMTGFRAGELILQRAMHPVAMVYTSLEADLEPIRWLYEFDCTGCWNYWHFSQIAPPAEESPHDQSHKDRPRSRRRRPHTHDPYVDRAYYFAGDVNVQGLVGPDESGEVELSAVFFAPGARTRPHVNEHDQILHFI